jgi:hypothetical protein
MDGRKPSVIPKVIVYRWRYRWRVVILTSGIPGVVAN